jgi:broad specificity phosphatase PhoE
MSTLTLIRHGQASILAEDYDQLSATGRRQAERLGEYWANAGTPFTEIYYGPARRHRQTGELAAGAYEAAGRRWPEAATLDEFDEYQAFELLRAAVPGLVETRPEIARLESEYRLAAAEERMRAFERLFQAVTLLWVREEIEAAGVEPWRDFCARVRRGIARITSKGGRDRRVAVFTSGGPIAAAAQAALELNAVRTLELSWASLNASFSEFSFSGERFSLASFNRRPHLEDASLLTFR